MQSINLIPQQEVQEQTQEKAIKVSTVFSIVIMVVSLGVAAYLFYTAQTTKNQIAALNTESEGLRTQIKQLSDVEIYARNLDKKYETLENIFATRTLYSKFSNELLARTPDGVFVESITIQKDSKFNITGFADNYILIAAFTSNLLDKNYDKGDPTLKTLFKTVTLNSVNLEKSRNEVSYSINVEMEGSLLKEK